MTCQEFERLWNQHLDGGDAAAIERALESHAAQCAACRTTASKYQALRLVLTAWGPPPAAPAGFVDRFLARTDLFPNSVPTSVVRFQSLARLAAAAVVLLAGLLALRVGLPGGARPFSRHVPERPTRPLTAALADASSATWDLARSASAPAARIGSELLKSGLDPAESSTALPLPNAVEPASQVLSRVGDQINAGVRPLSGSARHAFGFLLGPAGDIEPAVPSNESSPPTSNHGF
jgi:hypothetical protein